MRRTYSCGAWTHGLSGLQMAATALKHMPTIAGNFNVSRHGGQES